MPRCKGDEACVFPVVYDGLCIQHGRMFEQRKVIPGLPLKFPPGPKQDAEDKRLIPQARLEALRRHWSAGRPYRAAARLVGTAIGTAKTYYELFNSEL